MSNAMPTHFEQLIMEAQARGASDMHLVAGEPPTLRINGRLQRTEGDALSAAEIKEIACAVTSAEKISQIERELGEAHRSFTLGEVAARISVARASGELSIAVRILPTTVPDVETLGVPKGLLAAAESTRGLIVISGRSGSGKSTVAYSLLDYINKRSQLNIHTFEDPVMCRLAPKNSIIQQREVGVDIPDTLTGLKQSMNMDPDVLLVSEIRTIDELQASITVAETGRLVIIVIHAESPKDAIQRMVDVFSENSRPFYRRAISKVLRCVSCQRLVPTLEGKRRGVFGVLVPDDEMRKTLSEGGDILARENPMPEYFLDMNAEIERMAREGIVSKEQARALLHDMQ